jgi:hypothetical protein
MIDKARLKQIEDSETIAMLCLRVAHRTTLICHKGCNLYLQLSETLMACRDHLLGNERCAEEVCAINERLDYLMRRTGVKDMTIKQLQTMAGEEFQPE